MSLPTGSTLGLLDVWRYTFPKDLRYCRQCVMLHSQIMSVTKRYKFKRYIPRRDIMDVIENYESVPYALMRWPVIRSLLLIRFVNIVRGYRGKTHYLISFGAEAEHQKLKQWMKLNSTHQYVEREKFEREVLGAMHVAALYQRAFRWVLTAMIILACIFFAASIPEHTAYVYFVYWKGWGRQEIVDWYKNLMEEHAIALFTEAYKDKLPHPCTLNPKDGYYYLQLLEFESPKQEGAKEGLKSLLFIPFPTAGHEGTFDMLGAIMTQCDGVILEGIPLENLCNLAPAFYFPLKEPYFKALGLHFRYYRIIHKKREPPKIYAGAKKFGRVEYWSNAAIPLSMKYLYAPFYGMHKAAAKIGWGRIKEAIADPGTSTIAVPWNIHQIANLEASILRQGWTMKIGPKVRWLKPDAPGIAFCDYFGIQDKPGTTATKAADGTTSGAVSPAAAPSQASAYDFPTDKERAARAEKEAQHKKPQPVAQPISKSTSVVAPAK